MNELASMAAKKAQAKANASPPPPPPFPGHQQHSVPSPGSAPLSARNLPPPPPPPHAPGALERVSVDKSIICSQYVVLAIFYVYISIKLGSGYMVHLVFECLLV